MAGFIVDVSLACASAQRKTAPLNHRAGNLGQVRQLLVTFTASRHSTVEYRILFGYNRTHYEYRGGLPVCERQPIWAHAQRTARHALRPCGPILLSAPTCSGGWRWPRRSSAGTETPDGYGPDCAKSSGQSGPISGELAEPHLFGNQESDYQDRRHPRCHSFGFNVSGVADSNCLCLWLGGASKGASEQGRGSHGPWECSVQRRWVSA